MARDPTRLVVENMFTLRQLENDLDARSRELLRELFDDVVAQIARIDPTAVQRQTFRQRRLRRLLEQIRELVGEEIEAWQKLVRQELAEIGAEQAKFARTVLVDSLVIEAATLRLERTRDGLVLPQPAPTDGGMDADAGDGSMCSPFESDCGDGEDNDCNRLTDCADFACANAMRCCSGGGETPLREDWDPATDITLRWSKLPGGGTYLRDCDSPDDCFLEEFPGADMPYALRTQECIPLALGLEITFDLAPQEASVAGRYVQYRVRFEPGFDFVRGGNDRMARRMAGTMRRRCAGSGVLMEAVMTRLRRCALEP